MLLARTAKRLYESGRSIERAEGTARIVRAYDDLLTDIQGGSLPSWLPLLDLLSGPSFDVAEHRRSGQYESGVLERVLADPEERYSLLASVYTARTNLRAAHDSLPDDALTAARELGMYVDSSARSAIERRRRDRFLLATVQRCQLFWGAVESMMDVGPAYRILRLGSFVERARMTALVLTVFGQGTQIGDTASGLIANQLRWSAALRATSGLKSYYAEGLGPIDDVRATWFLLASTSFPRSVASCLDGIRRTTQSLPGPAGLADATDAAEMSLVRLLNGAREPSTWPRIDVRQVATDLECRLTEIGDVVRSTYFEPWNR